MKVILNKPQWISSIVLLLLLCTQTVCASPFYSKTTQQHNPLEGKKVAVYISRKNFQFTSDYNQYFAGLIQKNDSLNLTEEDIKTGMTIWLGNYFSKVLNDDLHTDSSFFANAVPGLTKAIVTSLNNNNFDAAKKLMPENTQYILMIDGIRMRKETRRSLFTFSNRFYNHNRKVTVAEIQARLISAQNGAEIASSKLYFDENTMRSNEKYINKGDNTSTWDSLLDETLDILFKNFRE